MLPTKKHLSRIQSSTPTNNVDWKYPRLFHDACPISWTNCNALCKPSQSNPNYLSTPLRVVSNRNKPCVPNARCTKRLLHLQTTCNPHGPSSPTPGKHYSKNTHSSMACAHEFKVQNINESSTPHYEELLLFGRLIVKLRRILSPHAELSSTSRTFSALTALPRLLLSAEPPGSA
jgi:hypothetical protein